MRQSYPFLLGCIKNKVEYKEDVLTLVNYLVESLPEVRDTDLVFEYGEIVTSLAEAHPFISDNKTKSSLLNTLTNELVFISELVKSKARDIFKEDVTDNNVVFQLNWLSQSVRGIYEIRGEDENHNDYNHNMFVNTSSLLVKMFSKIVTKFNSMTESNFFCVAFEGLAFIRTIVLDESTTKINELDTLEKLIEKLLKMIHSRINSRGLVEFTTKEARVDITGHFLNGIDKLRVGRKNMFVKKGGCRSCGSIMYNTYIANKLAYISVCTV
ncbi:hypothetical protein YASMINEVIRUS_1139 [Yasminevirus sp. GU-2018]|uniref:Uncharacterized protein n=1 Tax=Yasminevirus sp. GU-2018 TaxID=2420051 RepID=A0A5K0U9J0_9VIRU|nr:hypothetical protein YASMINEVIRUS_1139 [Yasminevirus sp. GU-2018]